MALNCVQLRSVLGKLVCCVPAGTRQVPKMKSLKE